MARRARQVINLSDADLALRTHDELATFLRTHKGRVFMAIDGPAEAPSAGGAHGGATVRRRHAFSAEALRRNAVIECGGFGFVSVNTSFNDSAARRAIGPPCCVER